jgi:hypothetical protein
MRRLTLLASLAAAAAMAAIGETSLGIVAYESGRTGRFGKHPLIRSTSVDRILGAPRVK